MNYNKILIDLFWDDSYKRLSSYYRRYNQKKYKYPNINQYLINLYEDTNKDIENLYRLIFHIDEYPLCPICGKRLQFIGKPNNKGLYSKTCSKSCSTKLTNNWNNEKSHEHSKQTKLEKYGNLNNFEKIQQTKLERYGNENFNNIEKTKQTKLEKYNDENYNNREKYKQTKLEKYGNSSYVNPNKAKQTKLERYGNKNYNNIEKIKQTCLEKYGVKAGFNNGKAEQTKLERYGDPKYNNIEKAKQTCLEKYGKTSFSKTNQFKYEINWDEAVKKQYQTKKENQTFNTSNPEDESYKLLKVKYPDILRQYKSNVYPFNCDFYIPSLDLYIECNYHWTHSNKLYEGTKEDNLLLNEWKNKNTEYYNNAIKTWTYYDVEKYKIAKENNLNYLLFYNINQLKEWLKK